MKQNYQILLDEEIEICKNSKVKKRVLMHACCAPCSSYVMEYLDTYFDLSMFFYNPNISPKSEFDYRSSELARLINSMPLKDKPELIIPNYNDQEFFNIADGLQDIPEGGARCYKCYALRLEKTAKYAAENNYDYFCTTLSISPYKNAEKLNEIGIRLSEKYGIKYLYSDFKKKNGYKRSIELSHQYNLYRQNYCGCIYSKK